MSGYTSWAVELPPIHHNASFEVEDVTPAKIALDSDEFCGSGLPRIVGTSAALRRVLDMVRGVAPTGATVLINGATGTGNELIAEPVDIQSWRFSPASCVTIGSAAAS